MITLLQGQLLLVPALYFVTPPTGEMMEVCLTCACHYESPLPTVNTEEMTDYTVIIAKNGQGMAPIIGASQTASMVRSAFTPAPGKSGCIF